MMRKRGKAGGLFTFDLCGSQEYEPAPVVRIWSITDSRDLPLPRLLSGVKQSLDGALSMELVQLEQAGFEALFEGGE